MLFANITQGMEQQPLPPIFLVPKAVLAKIVGYLYEPHENPGTAQIIRFLRSTKIFYNSQELAGQVMAQMRLTNPLSMSEVDNWMQSAFDIGTPAAAQVLKNYLEANPCNWPKVHVHYGYMVLQDQRTASILKKIGANLNTPVNEKGQTAFLVVAQHYPDVPFLGQLLKADANINSCDVYGSNILMILTRNPQIKEVTILDCTRLLIGCGIDLNHCTVAGRSAAAIAQIYRKQFVQKAIECAGGKNVS